MLPAAYLLRSVSRFRFALVVIATAVAAAVRLLVERAHVVAEGAGATPVACALGGAAGSGAVVCVVSGGSIGTATLRDVLASV